MNNLDPVTPVEILLEEFLKPMGLGQYRLAKEVGVPAQGISEIVAGKRAITADTNLRLCRFFGLSNGYWLRAQVAHDTEVAERPIGPALKKTKPWSEHAAQGGRTIGVSPAWSWRLSEATVKQRANWEILGDRHGVHWLDIDEDINAEGMLWGFPVRRLWATSESGPKSKKKNHRDKQELAADAISSRGLIRHEPLQSPSLQACQARRPKNTRWKSG